MTWSQMNTWQKVFTIVVSILTIAGVEIVLFWDWSTAPLFEHIATYTINALIVFFIVKIAIWG